MSSRRVREKMREAKIARDVALEKSRRKSDLTPQEVEDITPKKKPAKSKNKASQKETK